MRESVPVARTVTRNPPRSTSLAAWRWRVVELEVLGRTAGSKVAVTPSGRPSTSRRTSSVAVSFRWSARSTEAALPGMTRIDEGPSRPSSGSMGSLPRHAVSARHRGDATRARDNACITNPSRRSGASRAPASRTAVTGQETHSPRSRQSSPDVGRRSDPRQFNCTNPALTAGAGGTAGLGGRGSGPRERLQRLHQRAPRLILGDAGLALAEEGDLEISLRVEELHAGDDAVDGRLAHDPGLGEAGFPDVQVEVGIKDVEPGAHLLHAPRDVGADLD